MKALFFDKPFNAKIESVYFNSKTNILIDIKREDEIHPFVSGNKFRKLKYNIAEAISKKHNTLLTYGGAYSNHICATAAAAHLYGLQSIGIIRGEELIEDYNSNTLNPTLRFAKARGMKLVFINREKYRHKEQAKEIEELKEKYGDFYRVPEGGTNLLAVKGCEEILTNADKQYDYICCCVGTGGTLAGLINASDAHQRLLGFSALKGHSHSEISQYTNKKNWEIFEDSIFKGYAKSNNALIEFINSFYRCTSIKLDPIYTGKMLYRLFDMVNQNYFPEGAKILAIHSGGLQAVEGFNQIQLKKGKAILQF